MTAPSNLFNRSQDSLTDYQKALQKARAEKKNLLIEFGGGWCEWCDRLNKFILSYPDLASMRANDYIHMRVHIGRNFNSDHPLFWDDLVDGVPHFLVVKSNGSLIHSQLTDPLEEGDSYSYERIFAFLSEWSDPDKDSKEIPVPADYLKGKVAPASDTPPAALLLDGHWCGHGETRFRIFDVAASEESIFSVRLPGRDSLPMVIARSDKGNTFPVYDARQHPASLYYLGDPVISKEPHLQPFYPCPQCGQERFTLALGFEVPKDSETPDDTSWFALAARCVSCQWQGIIYDDKTA
ncbi:MAG TPA: thioredoxin family protein [Anaerolineaceae bacterium]|nr:thioredoxin family protein [Anaerolineaceae bacterium]HPN51013.1 thioredoxin family protein [Anaerolineaceae bacterium]